MIAWNSQTTTPTPPHPRPLQTIPFRQKFHIAPDARSPACRSANITAQLARPHPPRVSIPNHFVSSKLHIRPDALPIGPSQTKPRSGYLHGPNRVSGSSGSSNQFVSSKLLHPAGSPVTTHEKICISMSPKGLLATSCTCPLARQNPPNHFVSSKFYIARKPFTATHLRTTPAPKSVENATTAGTACPPKPRTVGTAQLSSSRFILGGLNIF